MSTKTKRSSKPAWSARVQAAASQTRAAAANFLEALPPASTLLRREYLLALGALACAALGFLAGSLRYPSAAHASDAMDMRLHDLPPGHHAVALTNGSVYIGQLGRTEAGMPVLRSVYYVHCEVNKQTRKVTNMLVKRGKEWHGPDRMYLNPAHVLLIEPVSTMSRVAELVRQGGGISEQAGVAPSGAE